MTVHGRHPNRTRRIDPDQLTLANEYRGFLKRANNEGTKSPNPPEFVGACTIDGSSYWISGWIDRKGKPSLQLVLQLAVRGSKPYRRLPDDLRLRGIAPSDQRGRTGATKEALDERYGAEPPY